MLVRRDGSPIAVRTTSTNIVDAAGRHVGTVGISWDVTQEKRLQVELEESREQLQALTRRLIAGHELERGVLARELHDDLGQALTAIRLGLEASRRTASPAGKQQLDESIQLVDQAIDRVRGLARDLRPAALDDLGLVPALRGLLKRHAQRAGFEARLTVNRFAARLPTIVETCSFRLTQEALTNVVRHAAAHRVDITLHATADALRLTIHDDGRGFDVGTARRRAASGESLGLLSMQERVTQVGGQLQIRSIPGQGTTLDATIPLAGQGMA
jgi:signal transduction histidine kinase